MTGPVLPDAELLPRCAMRGPMLELIKAFDWSKTAVGPIEEWSDTLTVTTRLMLASRVPMVMLMGRAGVLIYNDGYAVFAGGRHPSILGVEVAKAWPEIADFNKAMLDRVFAGETISLKSQKLALNRSGVTEDAWMDLDYSPVLDSDGVPVAELVIVSETTARFRAEADLARTNEKLSFALAASGAVGAWDWDLVGDLVTADARFAAMFGVPAEEAAAGTTFERFFAAVHPGDRTLLTDRIAAAVAARGEFRAEFRIIGPDGAPRWVMALGRAMGDGDGPAIRLPGVVIDITERKAAEEALAASEASFRVLADSMPQMVWSTRPDGFTDYYNARWYEFTGVPAGSTDGEAWDGLFHADDQPRAREEWRKSLETGEPYHIEYRLRHHGGEYRWTLGMALPVRDAAGNITRWFGTCTDIHASRLAAEEREVIAQELSHRIKNIFSVLTGIIALSARSHPVMKPFADQLRLRISAMGKAHDLVRPHSQASLPSVNQSSLRALLEQLVAPFHEIGHPRVVFTGEDTGIDDASATPIALFVHELATNAAKYGALAAAGGRVSVHGAVAGADYRLTWKETGGEKLVAGPVTEGFGSRLIALSVEGQLGGRLQRFWEEDGLKVELSVPLASLSRSSKLQH